MGVKSRLIDISLPNFLAWSCCNYIPTGAVEAFLSTFPGGLETASGGIALDQTHKVDLGKDPRRSEVFQSR